MDPMAPAGSRLLLPLLLYIAGCTRFAPKDPQKNPVPIGPLKRLLTDEISQPRTSQAPNLFA